jgi:hypothetical protein
MTRPLPPIILSSPKLTEKLETFSKLETQGKHWSAEINRLNEIRYPGISEPTVRVTMLKVPLVGARIGVFPTVNTAISTGPSEKEAADCKADALRRTLAGEEDTFVDINAELQHAHRKRAAIEAALEHLSREIKKERDILTAEHCKMRLPERDELMKRLFKALAEVHDAQAELSEIRRQFADSGVVQMSGILSLLPAIDNILGNSRDQFGDVAELFRAGKESGFVKTVPVEYAV